MLELSGLSKRFGSLQALDDLSLSLARGEIVQGLQAPEAFGQAGQFEHRGSFGFGDGATGPVERVHESRTRPP